MSNIIINGKSYNVSGNNIVVQNNQVLVDGKLIQGDLSGDVTISFEGDLANLTTHGSATINGDVHGGVDAGGSVQCGNVSEFVDAGGSVQCLQVGGDVDAGGSIKMRK